MSKFLISTFLLTLLVATRFAHAADSFFLLNPDGSVKYMNQYDAMKACPVGSHLPTVRELAIEAQASGAKGILEVSQVDLKSVPSDYYLISALNPSGQKDEFYFSTVGYVFGDGGAEAYWSSSVPSSPPDVSVGYVHMGVGGGSAIGYAERDNHYMVGVRCFPGH